MAALCFVFEIMKLSRGEECLFMYRVGDRKVGVFFLLMNRDCVGQDRRRVKIEGGQRECITGRKKGRGMDKNGA